MSAWEEPHREQSYPVPPPAPVRVINPDGVTGPRPSTHSLSRCDVTESKATVSPVGSGCRTSGPVNLPGLLRLLGPSLYHRLSPPVPTHWGRVVTFAFARWHNCIRCLGIRQHSGTTSEIASLSPLTLRMGRLQTHQMPGHSPPVSYTHLTLPTNTVTCRSRWSPYH